VQSLFNPTVPCAQAITLYPPLGGRFCGVGKLAAVETAISPEAVSGWCRGCGWQSRAAGCRRAYPNELLSGGHQVYWEMAPYSFVASQTRPERGWSCCGWIGSANAKAPTGPHQGNCGRYGPLWTGEFFEKVEKYPWPLAKHRNSLQ